MSSQRGGRKRVAEEDNLHNQRNQQQRGRGRQEEEHSDESHVDEYALRRLRNNAAVNKTRQKKRMEQAHTSQRVRELREENAQLERTLDSMRKELALLKEMVVVCAAKGDTSASTHK